MPVSGHGFSSKWLARRLKPCAEAAAKHGGRAVREPLGASGRRVCSSCRGHGGRRGSRGGSLDPAETELQAENLWFSMLLNQFPFICRPGERSGFCCEVRKKQQNALAALKAFEEFDRLGREREVMLAKCPRLLSTRGGL